MPVRERERERESSLRLPFLLIIHILIIIFAGACLLLICEPLFDLRPSLHLIHTLTRALSLATCNKSMAIIIIVSITVRSNDLYFRHSAGI